MKEDKDSLRSIAKARVVDLVCEGPIEGLVNGLQGVYLDGTPIQNANGTYNFDDDLDLEVRLGTADQERISWLKGTEATESVGVEVLKATPIERTITDPNADAARVSITIPQLMRTENDGDVRGSSVEYKISLKTASGSFVDQDSQWDWVRLPGSGEEWTSATTSDQCSKISGVVRASAYLDIDEGRYNPRKLVALVQYRAVGAGSWTTGATLAGEASNDNNYRSSGFAWEGNIGSFEIDVAKGTAYEVQVIVSSGANSVWFTPVQELRPVINCVISGKTTSSYQRSHLIRLPEGGAPWTIRVTRVTDDSTTVKVQNKTYWDTLTTVYEEKLRYPYSAHIGLVFNAKQFGSIPARAYKLRMLLVKIPSNYDPIARTYDGDWDGTFVVAWTNNPVWCWYDLATNSRYGAGDYITEDMLDKWSLYSMAQYCDELVYDGRGGWEPRFTCNLYLQTREEAYRVLSDMAAIFRGMTYWGSGGLHVVQDCPKDPAYLFTNANVEEGQFEYAGSSIKVRHNAVMVAWNDPSQMYRQVVEYVDDPELIQRWGFVSQTSIVALGCTSRAMAYRVGKWLLYTERYENESVSFVTGLEGNIPRPGDIIQVADQYRAGSRMGGRIASVPSAASVELDQTVTLDAGSSYTIAVVNSDGQVEERAVMTAAGDHSVLDVADPGWTITPEAEAIWILSTSTLEPELYRVMSVAEKDGGSKFVVTGILYNPGKFPHVDEGAELVRRDTSDLSDPMVPPDAPGGLTATDSIYVDAAKMVRTKLAFAWDPVPAQFVRGYVAAWREEGGNWTVLPETQSPAVEILDVKDGVQHELRVSAVNYLGKESGAPNSITYAPVGKAQPPADVASLAYAINPNTGRVELSWPAVADVDVTLYEVRVGASWDVGSVAFNGMALRCEVPAVGTSMTFWVKAKDAERYSSGAPSAVVTIQAPAQPTVTAEVIDNNVLLRWGAVDQSLAVKTYEVRRGSTWAGGTVIGEKSGLFTTVFESVAGDFTYWVAGIDVGGNYGTPGSVLARVAAPPDYVLQLQQDLTFSTLSNAIQSGGVVTLGVDTAETWAGHFTSRGWDDPQDQIDAGYPIYIQPGASSGYAEEVVDAGATLAGSRVNVTYTQATVAGSPTVTCTISVSNTSSTGPWTDYAGTTSVYAAGFRWVKVKVEASGGIANITGAAVRLDAKERTDNGTATLAASDSGGTTITFNVPFLSVKSIQVTPKSTAARIAIYDFAGGTNPTSFKALLYDTAGTRQSGDVSWQATGV